METQDYIGIYGAGLATYLGFRELKKSRRESHPVLVAHITEDRPSRSPGHLGFSMKDRLKAGEGSSATVSIHNQGGVATTVSHWCLGIAKKLAFPAVVSTLDRFGAVPLEEPLHLRKVHGMNASEIPAKGELQFSVTLWEEHRDAMQRERLLIAIVHTWRRDRPQLLPLLVVRH